MMRRLCAGLLLLATPALAEQQPERTDPAHQRGILNLYVTPQPPPPRTRIKRAQVVYRLPKDVPELAKLDAKLSELCRRGAFVQETNGFYWARTPKRTFGVAFSGGANLVDPQNKRKPGKVYFFEEPEGMCSVWVGDQAKLMPHYVGPLPGD
ncbi:hypothetical protein [Azospirillum sp. TSO22-1]|uniref:hypothetical protein n=1 Tax=Azospirillum sp. TSO22-1 TaxID=716789 RepID=UPI000D619F70|nr:hypothetical protein [Azospirillum sp. TSO22-1]PWC43145.1 hypothetical protein TSO221_20755 [Azospirillum sp. TSO22-1]